MMQMLTFRVAWPQAQYIRWMPAWHSKPRQPLAPRIYVLRSFSPSVSGGRSGPYCEGCTHFPTNIFYIVRFSKRMPDLVCTLAVILPVVEYIRDSLCREYCGTCDVVACIYYVSFGNHGLVKVPA